MTSLFFHVLSITLCSTVGLALSSDIDEACEASLITSGSSLLQAHRTAPSSVAAQTSEMSYQNPLQPGASSSILQKSSARYQGEADSPYHILVDEAPPQAPLAPPRPSLTREYTKRWLGLTREILASHELPHERSKEPTIARVTMEDWNGEVAKDLSSNQSHLLKKCGETGDGHFITKHFQPNGLCKEMMVFDINNSPRSDHTFLNLNMAPSSGVSKQHGTFDLMVTNSVFEHLKRPSMAIVNLNSLMKQGGLLVFSAPMVYKDHGVPEDFFRYSVHNVRRMLNCAGFDLQILKGLGNELTTIGTLERLPGSLFTEAEAHESCDGMTTNDCSNNFYHTSAAVAVKMKDVSIEHVQRCFG